MSGAVCGTCRHLLTSPPPDKEGEASYACRRYPPTPLALVVQVLPSVRNAQGGAVQVIQGHHVPVSPTGTCGEWSPVRAAN